jgi:hypothetical protein
MFPGSISYTSPSYRIPLSIKESRTDISLSRSIKLTTYPNSNNSLFGWLVADGRCWFVLREEYCWLVAAGWFVLREKYCWLVAPLGIIIPLFKMSEVIKLIRHQWLCW